MHRSVRACWMMVASVMLATASLQAASPSMEAVVPGIGQRGTEFSFKVVGAGLDEAEEVLFYRPGIQCLEIKPASENELTLRFQASADCPLGSHGFRIRTRRGITELRVFRITALPVVMSSEPNESPAAAQKVDHNVTIAGVIDSADVDCYQVTLKKGETFAAEVEAVRMGVSLLDTVLTIRGPDGAVLTMVDDTPLFRQDPFASIVAPQDGVYSVEVRETNNEGDENSRYALHLGRFPRPAAVYPAGGPLGQETAIKFLGDAAGEFTQTVTPTTGFELFAERSGLRAPTPQPFRLAAFPNILELEPNDDTAPATAVTLPVAFNGIIQQDGDRDSFSFQADADQTWQFELYGERIGSPLDAVMTISDESGMALARCDDFESHDPRLVFSVPQSGTYRLSVTDKRGAGGPLFIYRVEATKADAKLTAFLPRPNRLSQERQTVSIPRGNRVVTFVAAQRRGVTGPLQFSAGQLPDGVVFNGGRLVDDQFWTPVVLEAAAEAPLAGRLAAVEVSGQHDGRSIYGGFEQTIDLVNGPGDALYQGYTTDRLAVAVTEPAPFRIELDPPTTGLSQDGTITLRVRVDRSDDFTSPVDVTFPFLPPWVDGPDKLTIPTGESTGSYVARAWADATPRMWPICAEGKPGLATSTMTEGEMSARRSRRSRSASFDVRLATALVDLTIIPPPITGVMASVAGEQGQTVRMRCQLDVLADVPETMTATLEGLPNRVTVEPVVLTKSQRTIDFGIRLGTDAPVGEFPGLVCRLSGQLHGQDVSYCVARGCTLEIKPAGKLVTDADGRPLSRLEVLRREKQVRSEKTPSLNP